MAELLSVADLEAAKKQDTFHSEVITGKAGGVAGGADIDYATNAVTGQVQKTLPETLRDLGVKYGNPIKDWQPLLLVNDLEVHRYPATTGDIYLPIASLPFTTGATFDPANWAILQGTGDLDGLTVKPIYQQPVIADGLTTIFDVPGSVIYSAERYVIKLDGIWQDQKDSLGNNRWTITNAGELTFDTAPLSGVEVSSVLWQPITIASLNVATDVSFIQGGTGAVQVNVADKLSESASLRDYGATGTKADDATQAFINACMSHSVVYLIDGFYSVTANSIPDTAVVRKIIVQNATLWLEDGQFDFHVAGQNLEIDLTSGGTIHGGLRKVTVSADVAVGTNIIPCEDTTDIVIGQTIASSFQAVGATGGSKWTNSIRVAGDEYNTVIDKTSDSITVQYPVGAAGTNTTNPLWKNMVLGNALFPRAGLRFNGYGKVTIDGGKVQESRAGYYLSTEGIDVNGGLIVETHDVEYSGQFLDAFRIGGYSSFIANGGSMVGSYDLSKQLFVLQHRYPHKVQLNNVKVARGNNDLEFYTFGNSAGGKIGLAELNNCDMDGKWTLGVTADQVNTITGQTLQQTYGIIQDALHCWTCEQLTPTAPDTVSRIAGFIARDTKFKNYKRAVAGTTYINASRDFEVNNLLMDDCIYENTSPFYISVAATYKYKIINKGISNAKISRNTDNGTVYPLGLYNDEDGMHYSGTTIYDPKDGLVTDPTPANNNGGSVNGLISFDHLIVRGSGQLRANLPELKVSRITVDESFFYDIAGFDEYVPTKITLVNGGSLNSAHSFTTDRVATSSTLIEIPENDTNWHVIRKNVQRTSAFGAYFLITFSGYRRFADEYGFEGVAAGRVSTTATPITLSAAGYVNITAIDAFHWISSGVISHGFNLANGSVELIIDSNGDLAMRMAQVQPNQITLTVDVRGGKRYD